MTRRSSRCVRRLALLLLVPGAVATASPGSATTPPAAPSALTAVHSTGAVTLNWVDNAADETGFVIERCAVADCSTAGQIGTVGANTVTFVDTFFTLDNSYRVRAVNVVGTSVGSNVATVRLFSTGDVTARVTATPVTGTAPLTVNFDASGSSALNGTITIWDWSFGDNQTASGVTTSHTYSTPGVYAARVRVTATGGPFGNPTSSTAAFITVTVPPPLTAPTDLAATSPNRGLVNLTWTNQPTSATTLSVERCRRANCTNFTRLADLPLTATSYVDTTGYRGVTYRYRLAASNGTATVYSNLVRVTVHR